MFSKVSFLVIALAVYTSYGDAIPTNILAQRGPAVLPSSSAIPPPSSAPLTSSILQPASDGSGDEIVVGVTVSDGGGPDATQTVPPPLPSTSIAPSPSSSPSVVPPPSSSPSLAPPPSSSPSTSSSATTSATTASSSTSSSSAPKFDKNKLYAIYRDGNNFLKTITNGLELEVSSDQNFEFYSTSDDESVRWQFIDGLPSDNSGGFIINQVAGKDVPKGSLMLGLEGDKWIFNLSAGSDKSVAAKAKIKDAGITISTGGKWVGKDAEVANAAYTWKIKEIKNNAPSCLNKEWVVIEC